LAAPERPENSQKKSIVLCILRIVLYSAISAGHARWTKVTGWGTFISESTGRSMLDRPIVGADRQVGAIFRPVVPWSCRITCFPLDLIDMFGSGWDMEMCWIPRELAKSDDLPMMRGELRVREL
jgi:hypothetical protein